MTAANAIKSKVRSFDHANDPRQRSVLLLTGNADTEQHDPLLESKLRLLELQLREKDVEVQSANTSLAGAMETVENARGIRALNEKIENLELAERKLKAEVWLVEFDATR